MDPYRDPIGTATQGERPAATHHASDWGLGSLLMSLALVMLFPLVIAGVIPIPFVGRERGLGDVTMVILLADVVGYGVVALAGLAVLFALVGLISGFVRNQPV